MSQGFEVKTGLKQVMRCLLSFLTYHLKKVIILKSTRQRMECLSNNTILTDTDDIVIVGDTRQEVGIITRTNDLI